MTLEEDARRYVEALRSPANAWGRHMVPFKWRNKEGKLVEDCTTTDSWRSYMGRRYGVQETDKAIQETLDQSFTHRGTTWSYESTEEDFSEVYECAECGEWYRNESHVLRLDTMEAHVCIFCAKNLGLFEKD